MSRIDGQSKQVGTLEAYEHDLGEFGPNSLLQSPQHTTKMPLLTESILTCQAQGLSPPWDSPISIEEGDSVAWKTQSVISLDGAVLKESELSEELLYNNKIVLTEDINKKNLEDYYYPIDLDGNKFKYDNDVAHWCRQELLKIIDIVTEHTQEASDIKRLSSQNNVDIELSSKVPLSVLPLPFQEISTSYLEVSVFSQPRCSTLTPTTKKVASEMSPLPILSYSKSSTFGPGRMIPSYRLECVDRENNESDELVDDEDIRPEIVVNSSNQDISSCLNMSVFSLPSPTKSSEQNRPKLSLTPVSSYPATSPSIPMSTPSPLVPKVPMLFLPKEDAAVSVSSTVYFTPEEYIPVYDTRKVSITFKQSGTKKDENMTLPIKAINN